jgi:HD-GYP domain-containing protein (c-di-GMP phosphodiesterase class II)
MTRVQKVLQVADTITGLTSRRSYREPKEKPQVIEILKSESASGKLSSEIVRKFINSYDDIMETVQRENKRMLSMYEKLKDNYEAVRKQNGLAGG